MIDRNADCGCCFEVGANFYGSAYVKDLFWFYERPILEQLYAEMQGWA